jgi:hypothetical protein
MKTTPIHLYDAHLFAMLRYLSLRIDRPASKKDIKSAMRRVWTLNPSSKEWDKEVKRVIALAQEHSMIAVEKGAGNGARLVGLGLRFLDEALEARRFSESVKLCPHYRRVLWPLPPAAPGSMDVAA